MRKTLHQLVGYAWISTAALVIAAAAMISIVRLTLPYAHLKRDAIASWVTEVVGRPVSIGDIDARWRGWAPEIRVTNIALLAEDGTTELLRFDVARINIAPLGSLFAQSLVPRHLVFSGIGVTLERDAAGRFSIAGLPPDKSPVVEWLARQRDLVITNTRVTLIDEASGHPPVALHNVAFSIRSRGDRRQIRGFADLPEAAGTRVFFQLDAAGNLLGPDWRGEAYLEIEDVAVPRLLSRLDWRGGEVTAGRVGVQVWSQWQEARLARAGIRLAGAGFRLGEDERAAIDRVEAEAHLERVGDGWTLEVDRFEVETPRGAWPETTLRARWGFASGGAGSVVLDAGYLDLEPIVPLLVGLAPLPEEAVARISQAAPAGRWRQVRGGLVVEPGRPVAFYVEGAFEGLTLRETPGFPGIAGLAGRLRANARAGTVEFTNAACAVQSNGLPAESVEVRDLGGRVQWARHGDAWTVGLPELRAEVDGVVLRTLGRIELSRGAAPYVDLVGAIDDGDLSRIRELFPNRVLAGRGRKWLRNAFVSGRVNGGGFVLRGSLAAFPFDHAEGSFQAWAEVRDVTMQYARDWPQATAVGASLAFDGRVVSAEITSGKIFDADITQAHIGMPDLFTQERVVRISGSAHGTPQDAVRVVMESPLRKTKAARVAEIGVDGEIDLDLDLNLPLRRKDQTEVLGQVRLGGNRVHSSVAGVTLDNLRGSISFTRDDWYGANLRADFDGRPVGLVVNGGLDDPNYDSEFRMTGTADVPYLLEQLRRYTPSLHAWITADGRAETMTGHLPWKATLTIPEVSNDGRRVPKRLSLTSTLSGLAIELPWPFGKRAAERRPLQLTATFIDNAAQTMHADLADVLSLDVAFTDAANGSHRVAAVDIGLGADKSKLSTYAGVSIHGDIGELPLNEWLSLLQNGTGDPGARLIDLPVRFDIDVGELGFLGQRIKGVQLHGAKHAAGWNIGLVSADAAGGVEIPPDPYTDGVKLQFDRIWLARLKRGQRDEHSIDPTRVPALHLDCKSFRYGDIDLGHAVIRTRPMDGGLELESLSFDSRHARIHADGDWRLISGAHQSEFDISVRSDSLHDLLANFGYAGTTVEGGASTIEIKARWPGMPSDFTLTTLRGTLRLQVSAGRLLDIDPGGSGRLFGLLSLQTLPRRLSLDFGDLFEKGFAFDSIDGLFELDGGNAYTNSLLMNGPAAKIDISGRTGLAEQDYDQQVIVTPALSSSIPVASALFGPAGVGVGAVIYLGQKMFKAIPKQVDRFLSRQYSITGSWENPVVERI